MKNYKHIIWDWNGTLLEDVDLCVSIINDILENKGLEKVSAERYKDIFTIPVIDYYKKLNFDFEEESFASIGRRFIDNYEIRKFECTLYKDSISALEFFYSNGISQSVLSGYYQETLEGIIEHFGLSKYFDNLVGLDNIYAGSKVENGKSLLKKIATTGDQILLVGDTSHDYEVAKEIGADCVLLSCGHQSIAQLSKSGVTILNNLEELVNYVKE